MSIPIFISTDKNYVIPAITLIASVVENTKEYCDFFILNSDLDDAVKNYIQSCLKKYKNLNIEFIKIDENVFKNAPINRHFKIATYFRFLIPEIKPELDKAVYLDVDMVVDCDIKELYNIDLQDKPLAAASEKCMDYMPKFIEYCKTINVDNKKYFNAGMMILNLKYFRDNNICPILFSTLDRYKDIIICVDQCIFNILFSENYKQLNYKYNVLTSLHKLLEDNKDKDAKAFDNIKIYHFAGEQKPWNTTICFEKKWFLYAKKVISKKDLKLFCKNKPRIKLKDILKKIIQIRLNRKEISLRILGKYIYQKNSRPNCLNTNSNDEAFTYLFVKSALNKYPQFFDEEYYYLTYPEARSYALEPLHHWCSIGWKKGFNPSRIFDTNKYLQENKTNINPLFHFFLYGYHNCAYCYFKNPFEPTNIEINQYLEYKKSRTTQKVIYTCIVNNYDDLLQQKYINSEWDYICYTDNLQMLAAKQIGIWEIRPIEYTCEDYTKINRWHKINAHKILNNYCESIYIDSNINILSGKLFRDIQKLNKNLVISSHFNKNCVYPEFDWVIREQIDNPDIVKEQLKYFIEQGFPREYGFSENNIIYRRHNEEIIRTTMEDWWNIVQKYSKRDQLSFSFIMWKNKLNINDYMVLNYRMQLNDFAFIKHNKERAKV